MEYDTTIIRIRRASISPPRIRLRRHDDQPIISPRKRGGQRKPRTRQSKHHGQGHPKQSAFKNTSGFQSKDLPENDSGEGHTEEAVFPSLHGPDAGDTFPDFMDSDSLNVDLPLQTFPSDTEGLGPDHYQPFIEAISAGECGFYQLSQRLFVVNGWNKVSNTTSVSTFWCVYVVFLRYFLENKWYHLDKLQVGHDSISVCMCPEGRSRSICLHIRFLSEFGEERFPFSPEIPGML